VHGLVGFTFITGIVTTGFEDVEAVETVVTGLTILDELIPVIPPDGTVTVTGSVTIVSNE
jgi:hypothetical protein